MELEVIVEIEAEIQKIIEGTFIMIEMVVEMEIGVEQEKEV